MLISHHPLRPAKALGSLCPHKADVAVGPQFPSPLENPMAAPSPKGILFLVGYGRFLVSAVEALGSIAQPRNNWPVLLL